MITDDVTKPSDSLIPSGLRGVNQLLAAEAYAVANFLRIAGYVLRADEIIRLLIVALGAGRKSMHAALVYTPDRRRTVLVTSAEWVSHQTAPNMQWSDP